MYANKWDSNDHEQKVWSFLQVCADHVYSIPKKVIQNIFLLLFVCCHHVVCWQRNTDNHAQVFL